MAQQKRQSGKGNSAQPRTVTTKITKVLKPGKVMKQIFLGKVMSFSGDFSDINWDHEKMANWIKAHGGDYVREVTDDTTHLICTIKDYKKKTTQVKKALELGSCCNIVVSDWLDECLNYNNSKTRYRNEKGYSLERALKRIKQTATDQIRYRASFEDGVKASQEMVDNSEWTVYGLPLKGPKYLGLNHLYVDHTGFEYKIICTRINTEGKVKSEKYIIYLFESNSNPHHYLTGAKLIQPGRPPSYWKEACHPKPFWESFKEFTRFFESITGIAWDDRLDEGPSRISDPFRYMVPKYGTPLGHTSPDKKHPDERAMEKAKEEKEREEREKRKREEREQIEEAPTETSDSAYSGIGFEHYTDSEVEEGYDSDNNTIISTPRQRSVSIKTILSDPGDT